MTQITKLAGDLEILVKSFDDSYEKPTVTASINADQKTCTIHIKKMYQGLGKMVSFKAMSAISDLLGTEEIDLENEYYRSGCESCDWGSQHSVDIVCKNITL